MSSSTLEKKSKNTKDPSEQISEIPALGRELGADVVLPFTNTFRPESLGLTKNKGEELVEVLGEEWNVLRPTIRQLVTMRRMDGHARALYRLLTLPIRAALATATFKAAEDGMEEAEFIEAVFRTAPANGGMTNTFQRFMGQLLGALFEGYAAFEKVFWIPDRGPLKGKITLKKLAYRPTETVTFISDKTGGFAGIRQRTSLNGKYRDCYIDPEYSFYYAAQEDERKFYGVSFFESAFPHYDAKAKSYFTAHLAAQRAAVGTRVGSVPPNASKGAKDEFARNLSNLALAQWMMVPEGFKVDVLRDGGNYDFLNLINHHNHMMSESVLANFFDKDTGGGTREAGSLVNFAQPGDDMFVLMIRAVMDDIANSINHYIIPQLVDYNFDGSKYPQFAWGAFTDEQKAAIAHTFDKLAAAGQSVNISPEFMRELEKTQADEMGLSIDWAAVEAREAEAKAALADQMAANQAIGGDGGGAPGQPMPDQSAPAPLEMTDEDLSSMDSLSDVIEFMGDRADSIADSRGLPADDGQPTEDGAQAPDATAPTKKAPKAAPKKTTRIDEVPPVALAGISDDMLDWAEQMLDLSEGFDDE